VVDTGSRAFFLQMQARVAQVLEPEQVTRMILCHQDPDVAASMVDWLSLNPHMEVCSSPLPMCRCPTLARLTIAARILRSG